jgi:hypothetical protein
MTAKHGRLFAMVAVLGLFASPARAQMFGNPVYFSPKQGVGLTIAGDYGRGLNDASGKTNYFGGRATLGLPVFAVTVGGGSVKAEGADGEITFGANVGVTVLKGPAVPVTLSLQAGVGSMKIDPITTMNIPLGAALAFNVNSPGASVEPWVAPRVQLTRVSGTIGGIDVSSTETNIGASGGVNVGLPSGLGFHLAVDWLNVDGGSPLGVGAGLHYTIKIPSLGPVGP